MGLSRRTLLKAAAGTAVIAAGGGVLLALRGTVLRAPREPLRVLSPEAFSVVAAVADRFHPGDDEFPSAWDVRVPEKIDALAATLHPGDVEELLGLLDLLESAAAGLLLDGRTQTFTASSPGEQDRVLAAWRTSGIGQRRTGFRALHKLCGGAYWSSPEVWPVIGYPGPPPFGHTGGYGVLPGPA